MITTAIIVQHLEAAAAFGSCGHTPSDLSMACRHCLRRRLSYLNKRATDLLGWQEKNREATMAYQYRLRERGIKRKAHKGGWYSAASRRAKRAGARVEEVCRWDVFDVTDGRCHLCGLGIPTDESITHTDPLYYEVDHIVPMSKGGALALENLMPSHRTCNALRGNRDMCDDVARECREAIDRDALMGWGIF